MMSASRSLNNIFVTAKFLPHISGGVTTQISICIKSHFGISWVCAIIKGGGDLATTLRRSGPS